MTDATIVGIVSAALGAVPPTILALATLLQSRKNAVSAHETSVKLDTAVVATNAIQKKADEIHAVTNGNLSKVTAELTEAQKNNAILTEKINSLQTIILTLGGAKPAIPVPGDRRGRPSATPEAPPPATVY